jgi:hypothetical protein
MQQNQGTVKSKTNSGEIKQLYNNGKRFQFSTFNNGKDIDIKINKRNLLYTIDQKEELKLILQNK